MKTVIFAQLVMCIFETRGFEAETGITANILFADGAVSKSLPGCWGHTSLFGVVRGVLVPKQRLPETGCAEFPPKVDRWIPFRVQKATGPWRMLG